MHAFDPASVTLAQSGDEQARTRLLTTIEPILRSFFLSRIGRVAIVDDLIQNTLIRIHRGLEALENPARLKAFAMKAALFELQDHYRGRYSAREALFDPDLPTPGSVGPEDAGLRIDLDRALDTLTDHARQILELRELGYPYADIAETLDTTEAAVKMQVKRAFARLRAVLTTTTAILLAFTLS
ncbi:MAG: sigma-70 family RNA polymerase sigma factor [Rubricoccaceae bacterium]